MSLRWAWQTLLRWLRWTAKASLATIDALIVPVETAFRNEMGKPEVRALMARWLLAWSSGWGTLKATLDEPGMKAAVAAFLVSLVYALLDARYTYRNGIDRPAEVAPPVPPPPPPAPEPPASG